MRMYVYFRLNTFQINAFELNSVSLHANCNCLIPFVAAVLQHVCQQTLIKADFLSSVHTLFCCPQQRDSLTICWHRIRSFPELLEMS